MNKTNKKLFGKALASALALSIGVCSVFGGMITSYAADCDHEFADSWSNDSVNHWHAATCGHEIISDAEPHNYVKGKCTVCNAQEPVAEHVHTYNTLQWKKDGKNHWHVSTCEHYILKDMEAHNFVDGKCSVCEEPEPEKPPHVDPPHVDPPVDPDKPEFTSVGGYNESLYAEFEAQYSDSITASYKLKDTQTWNAVDSELIRDIGGGKVRVDVIGISAGSYSLKVNYTGGEIIKDNISVSEYDRSGYAHFGKTDGVGAYKDDGTPKDNAQIIYVNEATKNSVTATIGNKQYKGIVAILGAASQSKNPLIVRISGQISAATWKEGNVTYTKTDSNVDSKGNLLESAIVGKNGKKLPTSSADLTQEKLIAGGYNELDTSKYSVLNGLSSKATYKVDSKTGLGAYDSAWNNCAISGAKNVTLEGIGNDAEIFQWGLTWANSNSIEVRNITFDDYTEDACSFEGSDVSDSDNVDGSNTVDGFLSKHLWIHNCTINQGINYWDVSDEQDKHEGDGGTDFKRLSYVTISYVHYFNNHKTGLIGGSDTQTTANVTFHHNYYEQCSSRLPLGRQANMHMYNNYYYKSSGTNMSLRAGAYALIEYCYFDNANNPVTTQNGDGKKGVAKMFGCKVDGSGSKALDTKNYNITVVTDRTKAVANDNRYNQTFDTDPAAFYYDAVNKKSDVSNLITNINDVKTKIPELAGANR